MKTRRKNILLLLFCLLVPAVVFCLPGALPTYSSVWLFKLWIPLAVADLIFTAALYVSANSYSWWFSLLVVAMGAGVAFLTDVVPGLGFFIAYLLGSLTYVLLGHFMRKDEIRVRIAAPLFGKFVMVWLIGRQMVLPMMNADADTQNIVKYTIAAPHVVTCLLGGILGAFLLHVFMGSQKAFLPSASEKAGGKRAVK